jgi:Transmembrane domain of unknown function (DUF3566)
VDQRVEPPSWLPGGAAGSDTKGPASPDPAVDGPASDGLETEDPASFDPANTESANTESASAGSASSSSASSGSATPGSASSGSSDAAGDLPEPDAADMNAYSYGGETVHSNGQDAEFGTERAPVSAYGQEGSGGGVGNPLPYPAQYADTTAGFADTTAGFADTTAGFADTTGFRDTAGFVDAPGVRDTGGLRDTTGVRDTTGTAEGAAGASRRAAAVFAGASRPKARTGAGAGGGRGRRADLVVARLEPWSVMKFSFLISLVAWVMLFVAVAVLYFALSSLGVFESVQKTLTSVTSSSGSAGVSMSKWFSASRILGYTMLIGAVNIVLITALSTVGAMVYNLVTHMGGGIEVTLRETD